MVDPPTPAGDLLALSLREGAWLALLGSVAIVLGGMWPRCAFVAAAPDARVRDAWSGLSGWTPERLTPAAPALPAEASRALS